MVTFFDTSALVKLAVREPGWESIESIFSSALSLAVSPLTRIEFHSALRRLVSEKNIREEQALELHRWYADMAPDLRVSVLNHVLEQTAIDLLRKTQLRTLDLIQLASAYILKPELDAFVVCDKKLSATARELGLPAVNPTEPGFAHG